MAISDRDFERVAREARDTVEKNTKAVRESEQIVGAIWEQQQRSEWRVKSMRRKLVRLGAHSRHAAG